MSLVRWRHMNIKYQINMANPGFPPTADIQTRNDEVNILCSPLKLEVLLNSFPLLWLSLQHINTSFKVSLQVIMDTK